MTTQAIYLGQNNSVRGILLSVQYQHNCKFIKAKGVDKCKAKAVSKRPAKKEDSVWGEKLHRMELSVLCEHWVIGEKRCKS